MERVDHAHRSPVRDRQPLVDPIDVVIRVRRIDVKTRNVLRGEHVFDPALCHGFCEVDLVVGIASTRGLDRTGAHSPVVSAFSGLHVAKRQGIDGSCLDAVENAPGPARFEFESRGLERGHEFRGKRWQLGAAQGEQGHQGQNRDRGVSHGGLRFRFSALERSLWVFRHR